MHARKTVCGDPMQAEHAMTTFKLYLKQINRNYSRKCKSRDKEMAGGVCVPDVKEEVEVCDIDQKCLGSWHNFLRACRILRHMVTTSYNRSQDCVIDGDIYLALLFFYAISEFRKVCCSLCIKGKK